MVVLPALEAAARAQSLNMNFQKSILIIAILAFTLPVLAQKDLGSLLKKYNSGDVPYTSVQELRMHQLNQDVLILDAREIEEYDVSHLNDALFVGYDNFQISTLDSIPKDKKIVVYCSLGIRSENIGRKLQKAGFRNVANLYGGIFEWKKANYPVYNLEGKKTNKVHAFSKSWSKWLENAEKVY